MAQTRVKVSSRPSPDWQSSKNNVCKRNAVMLNKALLADVHFIVGSESTHIAAHRCMLAAGSSVFYAMFLGGLAEDEKEVTIPDVEPEAFRNLLKWVLDRIPDSIRIAYCVPGGKTIMQ